jgi:hypothetical protein
LSLHFIFKSLSEPKCTDTAADTEPAGLAAPEKEAVPWSSSAQSATCCFEYKFLYTHSLGLGCRIEEVDEDKSASFEVSTMYDYCDFFTWYNLVYLCFYCCALSNFEHL